VLPISLHTSHCTVIALHCLVLCHSVVSVCLSSVTYALWLNGASYRKTVRRGKYQWHTGNRVVTWPITSRDPERSRSWSLSAQYPRNSWVADDDSRRRLRSATTHQLMVPRTRLRTVGDRAFGIAGARVWNDLPSSVVSAPSLAVFKKNLKTHLFRQSYSHWRQRVLLY